jgi:DNA-binding CsgD family transcriptional regulator
MAKLKTAGLTKAEKEVLALIQLGKTRKEIAVIRFNALGTIYAHVHRIKQKGFLGNGNTTQN